MGLRMHRQVGALRKVLSQQAIGVLVRSALPRALRIAKIDVDVGRQRKSTMSRQFLAPVPGQGLTRRTTFVSPRCAPLLAAVATFRPSSTDPCSGVSAARSDTTHPRGSL